MKKVIMIALLGIIIFTAVFGAGEYVPDLKVIYQGLESTQNDLSAPDKLVFEFNLRIDHVGICARLGGSSTGIEKILLSDGKRLEIYLEEPLSFENEYVVELLGIKEIYSSTPLSKTKFTLKMNDVFLLEKKIIAENREYKSVLKNNSSSDKTVTFVVSAKEKQSGRLLDVKIITKKIPSGDEAEFLHTFSDLKECEITEFGFYNLRELIPLEY